MDKGLRRLRVVSADREKRAMIILKREAGWDGKYPIPVKKFGGVKQEELGSINLIHTSGDDGCYWVSDAVSALMLYFKAHDLEKSPEVLCKRKTFKIK